MLSRIGTCYNPCSNISEDELNEKSDYLAGHVNSELHIVQSGKNKGMYTSVSCKLGEILSSPILCRSGK